MLRAVARQGTGPITKRVIDAADPAAGVDFSYRVPGGKAWELLAVTCLFQASADAADRDVTLLLDDGHGNANVAVQATVAVAANALRLFSWSAIGTSVVGSATVTALPLPSPWYMLPDERIRIVVDDIDNTDQISLVRIVVLETNTGDEYAAYFGADAMGDHLEALIDYARGRGR